MLLQGPKFVFKIAQSRGFNEQRLGGLNRSPFAQVPVAVRNRWSWRECCIAGLK
jgi:hypothetical protein